MGSHPTRRDALRLGGATAALTLTGGLAGCSALPFFGGPPGYTKWIYEPGAVGDRTHLQYRRGKFNILRRHDDEVGGALNNYRAAQQVWPLGTMNLQFDQVKEGFNIAPRSGRVTGDFESNVVGNALTNKNFEEDGALGDYAVYTKSRRAVAVTGGEAIYCDDTEFGTDVEPRAFLETVVDAGNGNADRYVDTSDPFEELTVQLGDATIVVGATFESPSETDTANGQFAGAVAAGQAISVNGDNSQLTGVVVFESEDSVDMEAIGEWADGDAFSSLEDPSTSQKGSTAVVSGKAPTGEVTFPSVF